MAKLSDVKIDSAKLEQGAWVDEIPEIPGLRLKVRGTFNSDWRKLAQKLMEMVPRKKKPGGRAETDEQDAIITKCLIQTCLLDWDGLEDDDGKPIPFSKELAIKYLTDPDMRRFREGVIDAANRVADIKDLEAEDAVGNLVALSAGSGSGDRKSRSGTS